VYRRHRCNGGHIKANPYELFARLWCGGGGLGMSLDRARAVVAFRMSHLGLLVEMAAAYGWAAAQARRV
jgi:hypothetical protein